MVSCFGNREGDIAIWQRGFALDLFGWCFWAQVATSHLSAAEASLTTVSFPMDVFVPPEPGVRLLRRQECAALRDLLDARSLSRSLALSLSRSLALSLSLSSCGCCWSLGCLFHAATLSFYFVSSLRPNVFYFIFAPFYLQHSGSYKHVFAARSECFIALLRTLLENATASATDCLALPPAFVCPPSLSLLSTGSFPSPLTSIIFPRRAVVRSITAVPAGFRPPPPTLPLPSAGVPSCSGHFDVWFRQEIEATRYSTIRLGRLMHHTWQRPGLWGP